MSDSELKERRELLLAYVADRETGREAELLLHEADVAELLLLLREEREETLYSRVIDALPPEVLGATILELPERHQDELVASLDVPAWVETLNELDTDDATDLLQKIETVDEDKAYEILRRVDVEQKQDIEVLKTFDEDSAGALMQTELFSARLSEPISEALERLKGMVRDEALSNIHYVFVVDEQNRMKAMLSLEELIMLDFSKTFGDSLESFDEPLFVRGDDTLEEVAHMVERYDLSVVPVVDHFGHLLGRITSDDIYDLIEERATDQIYGLARLDSSEEVQDDVFKTSKTRARWLSLNLLTATLGAVVISFFAESIEQIVALAILMPIVASMGGVAGTQSLTVAVRQLALGEIRIENSRPLIVREMKIALFNGTLFAVLVSLLAWGWFKMPMLGVVIACAMFANMMYAGFFGAGIPLLLKRYGIDPAVASAVLLITVTDVAGFFTFLGLATWILL